MQLVVLDHVAIFLANYIEGNHASSGQSLSFDRAW